MIKKHLKPTATALVTLLLCGLVQADNIETLQSVGDKSKGTAEARIARDALISDGAKKLIPVLKAFKGSSLLAQNWLRSTFEAIADSEIKAGRYLPKDDLLTFVKNTTESPEA